jgi:hypothetical protein
MYRPGGMPMAASARDLFQAFVTPASGPDYALAKGCPGGKHVGFQMRLKISASETVPTINRSKCCDFQIWRALK